MTLDRTARDLASLVQQAQTVRHGSAPSGGRAGAMISLRIDGRPLQARCLVSIPPGPVVAVLTQSGWACVPVSATRLVDVREVESRQRRDRLVLSPANFAAAILYSVLNGVDTEVWLQDGGADPQLITTIPNRVALENFTATINVPRLGSDQQTIGWVKYPGGGLIDAPRNTENGGTNDRRSFEIETTAPVRFFNESSLLAIDAGSANLVAPVVNLDGVGNNGFISVQSDQFLRSRTLLALTGTHGATPVGGPPPPDFVVTTTTLLSVANALDGRVQRRPEGVFVYLKSQPYTSRTLAPTAGQDFGKVLYSTAADSFESSLPDAAPDPDPSDITGGLVSYAIFATPRTLNQVTAETSYNYQGDLFELINGGIKVESSVFGGSQSIPITVKGVASNATSILGVAVYPLSS